MVDRIRFLCVDIESCSDADEVTKLPRANTSYSCKYTSVQRVIRVPSQGNPLRRFIDCGHILTTYGTDAYKRSPSSEIFTLNG